MCNQGNQKKRTEGKLMKAVEKEYELYTMLAQYLLIMTSVVSKPWLALAISKCIILSPEEYY